MWRSPLDDDDLLCNTFRKCRWGLKHNWVTYYFPSLSFISSELATGTTFFQQPLKRSFKTGVSRRESGESLSQQKARRNWAMSIGLQRWRFPMSATTPRSMASFLDEQSR